MPIYHRSHSMRRSETLHRFRLSTSIDVNGYQHVFWHDTQQNPHIMLSLNDRNHKITIHWTEFDKYRSEFLGWCQRYAPSIYWLKDRDLYLFAKYNPKSLWTKHLGRIWKGINKASCDYYYAGEEWEQDFGF